MIPENNRLPLTIFLCLECGMTWGSVCHREHRYCPRCGETTRLTNRPATAAEGGADECGERVACQVKLPPIGSVIHVRYPGETIWRVETVSEHVSLTSDNPGFKTDFEMTFELSGYRSTWVERPSYYAELLPGLPPSKSLVFIRRLTNEAFVASAVEPRGMPETFWDLNMVKDHLYLQGDPKRQAFTTRCGTTYALDDIGTTWKEAPPEYAEVLAAWCITFEEFAMLLARGGIAGVEGKQTAELKDWGEHNATRYRGVAQEALRLMAKPLMDFRMELREIKIDLTGLRRAIALSEQTNDRLNDKIVRAMQALKGEA